MLRMIHGSAAEAKPAQEEKILMKDAAWPTPFQPGLEYNSPCHGPWNIVHIGMKVPGAHQIYVCGGNCNRGVVLTAAEMNASDRYSTLAILEEDLISGDMENLIIEGVTEILQKLPDKPTVVFLFTVCVHHFMGCDLDYVYATLRERFPEQRFVESFMDPIMQKGGITPDQKLRYGMHSFLEAKKKNPRQASIIGSDFPIGEKSEMKQMLKKAGYQVTETAACDTFSEYLSMGDSSLYLVCYPQARFGSERLGERLETPVLYLPDSFSYEEIDRQLTRLAQALAEATGMEAQNWMPDTEALRETCEEALEKAREIIGETAIAIDASAVPRYLGLARMLLSHGFRVIRLYGDAFSPEEREDYEWLREHAPELTLCATIHTGMRVFPRGQEEKVLAIGQKAAYFHQTEYFVNVVEGEGIHGYAGILQMVEWMIEAFQEKKDTRDLVVRKGWGCESII